MNIPLIFQRNYGFYRLANPAAFCYDGEENMWQIISILFWEDRFMRNRAEIKEEAKGLVRGGRVSPLVMTALLLVIGFMLDRLWI